MCFLFLFLFIIIIIIIIIVFVLLMNLLAILFLQKFLASADPNIVAENHFTPELLADAIRIIPMIFRANQVCLRFELYGCTPGRGTCLAVWR